MSKYVEASQCLLSKHICTLCYVSFGPNETCKNSLTFFNFLLVELNISDSKSRIGISVWSEDIVAKLSFVFVNNDLTLEWCQRDCKTQQKKKYPTNNKTESSSLHLQIFPDLIYIQALVLYLLWSMPVWKLNIRSCRE